MRGPHGYHTPVLLDEAIGLLLHRSDGVFCDGTLGGGGHFRAMAEKLSAAGTLIGIDRDPEAVAWNRDHLPPCRPRVILAQARFSEFDRVLGEHGIAGLDGVLLDLGVSSRHIDSPERGFSYQQAAPLDMRMDPADGVPAYEFLASSSADEIAAVLHEYGEVGGARRIARGIKRWSAIRPLKTSSDLRACCASLFGGRLSVKLLARIFQALRIAVNDELGELRRFCSKVIGFLKPGGRLAVISYHSLEDRIVKEFIGRNERPCSCPSEVPVCTCGRVPLLKRLTRKAVQPGPKEIAENPRSRSGRLRAAERMGALQ